MDNKNTVTLTATTFLEFLQLAFIVLKLCNVIDWSWFWVLSPIWMTTALILTIYIFITLLIVIKKKK